MIGSPVPAVETAPPTPSTTSIRRTSWRRCAAKVSTCATTLLITKLSGGSQSASTSTSSQPPRASRSRTIASQRGATPS